MAADIDELVGELEAEFGDAANALLTAEEYEQHLQRAIGEISAERPREVMETLATTDGSRALDEGDLTDPALQIYAVEYPVDQEPRRYVPFSRFAGVVEMLIDETPGDAEDVNVYYGAAHVVDDSSSSMPADLDRVALLGGAGYAAQQLQLEATNRANTAGVQAVRDWAAFSATKLDEFRRELVRLGSVLRTSQMYTPADPTPSQSTVVWDP